MSLACVDANKIGDSCITPYGEHGFCCFISKCDKLFKLLLSKPISEENKDFLAKSQCGWEQDQPLVCCNEIQRKLIPKVDIRAGATYLPKSEDCGIQNLDRVIGGSITGIGELPWVALLKYKNRAGEFAFHCSATLISRQHVITAAHCIYGRALYHIWTPIYVRLGEWDLGSNIDCIGDVSDYACADPHVDIAIELIIPHENYIANSKSQYHDIAIIRMERSTDFTDFIKPVCLPRATHIRKLEAANQKFLVAGWGKTEFRSRAMRLRKVYLNGFDIQACSNLYKQENVFITTSQLCAGGIKGRDSCNGDSGSGLLAIDDSDLSHVYWYLAGVVSFGVSSCGINGWPAVYTKVTEYVNWIEAHIK